VKKYFIASFLFTFLTALMVSWPPAVFADEIGVNKLTSGISGSIDSALNNYDNSCYASSLGVVYGGNIVYTKSYGSDHLTSVHEWASVSKPLTALLVMQMVEEGKISSIEDEIWDYTATYDGYETAMPSRCSSYPLRIRHLLTHQSGVSHLDSIFDGSGNLNLQFCPGQGESYSTNGFAMLGDILDTEKVSGGQSYATLVHNLGNEVGANLTAYSDWIAPGAYVTSNITDFSRFTIGVMNNTFVSSSTLYNAMLKDYGSGHGLGFEVESSGDDITAYHSGHNGTPISYMLIKPKMKRSVTFFCQLNSGDVDMYDMTREIDSILDSSVGSPCVNPVDCGASSTPTPTQTPKPTPTSMPSKKAGDVNGDGKVNMVDIGIIANAYGTNPTGDTRADLNGDGVVNVVDLGIVIDNYGV
jgi:CubicO group peptidase (beta-lactamase class C family)